MEEVDGAFGLQDEVAQHTFRKRELDMSFIEAVKTCYIKYGVLKGRAGRQEYWFFILYVALCSALFRLLLGLFPQVVEKISPVIFMIASIFLFTIPNVAVQVRRFHDRGISGYWLLPTYVVIPAIAGAALYFMIADSQSEYMYSQRDAFVGLGALWVGASIAILVVSALPSDPFDNGYGPPPPSIDTKSRETGSRRSEASSNLSHGGNQEVATSFTVEADRKDQVSKNPNSNPTPAENGAPSQKLTEAAEILLKYRDDIKHIYERLRSGPINLNMTFLNNMADDPKSDPEEIFKDVVLNFLGRPDMQWSDAIWLELRRATAHSPEACDEFIQVFPLLSETMSPKEISEKVIGAIRGKALRFYLFPGQNGETHRVVQHQDLSFWIDSELGPYWSAQDVYTELKTPYNRRVQHFMLHSESLQ